MSYEIPQKLEYKEKIVFNLNFEQLIQESVKEKKPSLMAIDATGIDSWQRSRHYENKILEDKEQMPYVKLDVIIDTNSMLIHDHVLRIKPRHDVIGANSILARMKYSGVKILGDKGYDSEKLHKIAVFKKNILFAPVRKSSRKKPKGKHRRRCFNGDEDYPRRNCVESVIYVLKSVRVHCLSSKNPYMKKREMAWCVLVYNLEVMNKKVCLITMVASQPFRTYPIKEKSRQV